MCGIFGVIGSENAAAEIYIGLMHLQHRGQDAAGILTTDFRNGGSMNMVKERGLVANVFDEEKLRQLKGSAGIGHTRYPTIGVASKKEAQPFFLQYPDGIGMAFNGNIVNYPSLKKYLRDKKRRYLMSDSDAEVMLNLFASEYLKESGTKSFFDSVAYLQKELVGAYSVVGMIANKGIFAFKDPNGIKPLIMGKKEYNGKTCYAFASESIALTIQGYNELRDLKPGEVVFIDKKLKVYSKVLNEKKHAHCVFEWVYFSTVESEIEDMPVYIARSKLGEELANKVKRLWPDLEIDLVIPIPDTSRPAANSLAYKLGIPYGEGLVKNRYVGRTFIMPVQKSREYALDLKLKPIDAMLKGKKVMVVDDSIVRGSTSKKIVKLLRASGVKKVYFLSTFPPIRYPCYYGIDFQREEELIAHNKKIKEIEKEIGADKLIYMDVESLKNCIGTELCTACVTGDYPTSIGEAKNLQNLRRKHIKRMVRAC